LQGNSGRINHTDKFKIPRQVEFVEELPKSAMGKVLRRILKDEEA